MKKKQYGAPKFALINLMACDVLLVSGVSLGTGEKGVFDDEIFG